MQKRMSIYAAPCSFFHSCVLTNLVTGKKPQREKVLLKKKKFFTNAVFTLLQSSFNRFIVRDRKEQTTADKPQREREWQRGAVMISRIPYSKKLKHVSISATLDEHRVS